VEAQATTNGEEWTSGTSVSVRLGTLLAIVGGFLDAYTYVGRHGVFANSQTGNVVLFAVEAARRDWTRAVRHLPPIAAFLAGVAVSETLKRRSVASVVRWPARAAIVVEIVVLLVVGALPREVPDEVVTIAIAFVASVQVTTFRTLVRWPYNTTNTTGNLRTFGQAVYAALAEGGRDAREQARGFGAVIAAFLAGAIGGGYLTFSVGPRAVWAAAAVLTASLVLFLVDERRG
jgi:uncharacterized membrane protein YoaK (UPF0700 family)